MFEQRLKKDMHVEVTSEDEGFKGAWYVAKILQDQKLMDKYVEVEYKELLAEDDESKKLTERVHVSFVRPLPPVGKGHNEVIEVNDVVDAFYNDGWWVGVVIDIFDDGRKFVVCFDDPPDTMECRRSDVRVHFDWVDGNWEKPQKIQDSGRRRMPSNHSGNSKRQKRKAKRQQTGKGCASTGMHFSLDSPIGNYPLHYKTLSHVIEKKNNKDVPDEIVEKGCIAEEFDVSVKEVENALPTHKCETPPKKDLKNKNRDWERHTVHASKEITNASTKGDSGLKRKRGRPKLLPKKQIGSTGAKGSSQKTVKSDSCPGVLGDVAKVSAEKHRLMLTTVDTPKQDKFQPLSKDSMMVTANKQHESGVQKHNLLCSETEVIPLLGEQADETVINKRIKWHKNSVSSSHNEINKIVDIESWYQGCIAEEFDMSVKKVEDKLPANNCETPVKKDQNKSRDRERHNVHRTSVSTKGDSGLKRKRGRPKVLRNKQIGSRGAEGSSWKTVAKDSCVGVLGNVAEISAENHCLMLTTVDTPREDQFQPLSKDRMMVTANKQHASGVHMHNLLCSETDIPLLEERADETVVNKRIQLRKNSVSSAHNEISKIVDSESRYQECDNNASRGDSSFHEICHSKDADMPIVEIPADFNEDQVSNSNMQIDKTCSTDSEDSRGFPVQRQCANANGMQDDCGTPVAKNDRMEPGPLQTKDGSNPGDLPVESPSHVDSNDKGGEVETPSASVCFNNVENHQSLPFLKGSPLWKIIESMEIFKKTAKKPHFSPLIKCEEETREGLAIGHMVTFCNLVENISTLQFSHPITVIESKLGILAELESHGFDVETVKACLTQLLSKKQREAELQKEYQDIGNTILYCVEEISKAEAEIAKLNNRIRELSAKLDDTVLKKKMKESEISTLHSKQEVVGNKLRTLQTDSENRAGGLYRK
ncbi:uncharacterized protein LOC141712225 isoform X2 [Apium graveolens]|uniref:uncharacterized protein LOC141712225 isoform X2 n=1 Tax=Apium graveolens TaxID=4045 RepID=UPI003D7BE30B